MIHLPRVLAAAGEVQRMPAAWETHFEQARELTPLLELKGEMEALAKFERMLAKVQRRLRSEP